ncbi:MAG: hypothetical protein H6719_02885 [Sandaracinaceae bacterium]|nr:hypothetical protein [Sandaracinaceae bacterium]
MNWTDKLGFCAAVLVCALLAPAVAQAQVGWLSDRSRAEGPGFRVGDFELHPGIGVELGYDSNLYYTDDADRLGVGRDSAILRAAAHLLFSTRGAQRTQEGEGAAEEGSNAGPPTATFRGGLSGTFYHFFNDNNRTNMEADADLALVILPERPFSIQLTENFGRAVRPFTELTLPVSYARIHNDTGLRLNFQTDGGVLKVGVGYNFQANVFEDGNFGYGNSLRHVISLNETFRFLPQTAIIHDTTFSYNDVLDESTVRGPLMNDGILLRTRIGLNGAFTTNFSVMAMVGYAAGFFNTRPTAGLETYDQEYESLVAQVEARWQIASNVRLVFGYDRDFQPSYIGNFFRRDRGYINFQTMIDRVFLIGTNVSLGYYEFGQLVNVDGSLLGTTATRGDIRLTGSLFLEYRFTDWLGVNGTVMYQGNYTDYVYDISALGTGALVDPASYNKVELWLGVRAFY